MRSGSLTNHQPTSGPGDGNSIWTGSQTSPASFCRSLKRGRQQNSHPESTVPRGIRVCLTSSLVPPPLSRHNVGIDGVVRVAARQMSGGDGPATAAADTSGQSQRISHTHVSARSKDYRSATALPTNQLASQPASTKIAYSTRKARMAGEQE